MGVENIDESDEGAADDGTVADDDAIVQGYNYDADLRPFVESEDPVLVDEDEFPDNDDKVRPIPPPDEGSEWTEVLMEAFGSNYAERELNGQFVDATDELDPRPSFLQDIEEEKA